MKVIQNCVKWRGGLGKGFVTSGIYLFICSLFNGVLSN
jgi:hypothetical protein